MKIEPFENYAREYDQWFDKYPAVFQSEVEAIRSMIPLGETRGIEVGLGTGRFARELGIKEGIEPAAAMREIAQDRGIEVMDAFAENLPYKDMYFDFVLMISNICYFKNIEAAFREGHRVLKKNGVLIVGMIDKESAIGKEYEDNRARSTFYKQANFYNVEKVKTLFTQFGFRKLEIIQTLFHDLQSITRIELAEPGYGRGSFVVLKGYKK